MSSSRRHNRESRLPPGQQKVADGKWPIIGERMPRADSSPWTLSVKGCVHRELKLSLDDLKSFNPCERKMDIHCVTRWSKFDVKFGGVLLQDILAIAGVNKDARFINFVSRSERSHSTSLMLDTAVRLQTMIVLSADGQSLHRDHGGPIRSVVPGKYFYKSVKWLETIELLAEDKLGYWEADAGYHNIADPWQEQRYMAPTIDRREAAGLIETRDFSNRDLRSIDASKRNLENLNATSALLRDANFSESKLQYSNFRGAQLSNSKFRGANLQGACFVGADLEGADLAGAQLQGVDFTDASLFGASFCDVEQKSSIATNGSEFDGQTVLTPQLISVLTPMQLAFVRDRLPRIG